MAMSLDRLTGNIANVSSFVDEMTLLSIRGAETPLGQRNHVYIIQSSRSKAICKLLWSLLTHIDSNLSRELKYGVVGLLTHVADVRTWIDNLINRLQEADDLAKFADVTVRDEYQLYVNIKNEFDRCTICSAPNLPHVRAAHELR